MVRWSESDTAGSQHKMCCMDGAKVERCNGGQTKNIQKIKEQFKDAESELQE